MGGQSIGVWCVVGYIQELGLKVALHKMKAIWFTEPRQEREGLGSELSGIRNEVKFQLRYLGIILYSHWKFDRHFGRLIP